MESETILDVENRLASTTSIRLTETYDEIHNYALLSKDVDKLPVHERVGTGSSALCIDTGALYMYEETTLTWYLM